MNKERKQFMKNSKPVLRVLAVVTAFACIATAADAPKLTFNFHKANVPGALQTIPQNANNAGVMVGNYEDKDGVNHGYILDGKNLRKVDDPKGTNTICCGVNLNGPIMLVGYYTNSAGTYVGFLYNPKTRKFKDIRGPKGAISAGAGGINDKGEIVGAYEEPSNVWHGFLLEGGEYKTLDVPGAAQTYATGINDKGYIVFYWTDSSRATESSIYSPNTKKYTKINVPGASNSAALSIDSASDVVYQWTESPSGPVQGALRVHATKKFYKFDYPQSVATSANGINDKHLIVGPYQKKNGLLSGYKATYK